MHEAQHFPWLQSIELAAQLGQIAQAREVAKIRSKRESLSIVSLRLTTTSMVEGEPASCSRRGSWGSWRLG
jgi:hypothetical protein